ncbi:flavodoxin [Brevibacterium sp. 5221]|uniref:Flavodoxin n=1 Tax=Brevibacterium rongguiense TaxID=2695267 RepID=A0A6N9H5M0_9MICO|nr:MULTISPECIES: NAD(P)H-dependent oxidoreductase [Brevibacterium]MYM19219.1 flavodoxin [Brevibacterium rongguiense]WAL39194.1 NAD(P)H-dependent oxidoreductase [Brevibacterium sp. BRM-1]
MKLLMVHHSPTRATQSLAQAARGVFDLDELASVELVERAALEATAEDVLAADAYALGTTVNFGYISGALKHFFDTTYYEVREATARRPLAYWIHGGWDTTGAERAMEQITTGLGWTLACPPVVLTGEVGPPECEAVAEAVATTAATLLA